MVADRETSLHTHIHMHTLAQTLWVSNQTEAGRTAVGENEFCSLEAQREKEKKRGKKKRKEQELPLEELRTILLLEAMLAVVVKGGEKICHSHPLISLSLPLFIPPSVTHTQTHSLCHLCFLEEL